MVDTLTLEALADFMAVRHIPSLECDGIKLTMYPTGFKPREPVKPVEPVKTVTPKTDEELESERRETADTWQQIIYRGTRGRYDGI